jgi:hypothetical protein
VETSLGEDFRNLVFAFLRMWFIKKNEGNELLLEGLRAPE